MTIIHEEQRVDNANKGRFKRFMKRFKVGALLRSIGADKEKGEPVGHIFVFLLGLVFTRKNLYETMQGSHKKPSFCKNTVYRFLARTSINWEMFIQRLSVSTIPEVRKLTSEARKIVNILDDTPYWRNRSKKVEMLSKCYDHSQKKYYKGFTMLNLGWSDGQTYMPVDFRLLASGNDKNLLEGSHVKDDKRTIAAKRRLEARKDKPTLAQQMLSDAKGTPAQTPYVLFDSWFASPSFILSVKGLGYDAVARLKNHENYRYLYNGKVLSLSQIYKTNKKRRGMSRYLLSVSVEVRHEDFPANIPAKIVFVRDRNNRKKWIALLSTDTSLNEDEVITLYGKRWDIEPFHKVLKSVLKLAKEFQLRSFDAITAHTAIVLTRYIFLSLESRENKDDRSIGGLFLLISEELDDIDFNLAYQLLLSILEQYLIDSAGIDKGHVDRIIAIFTTALPSSLAVKLAV